MNSIKEKCSFNWKRVQLVRRVLDNNHGGGNSPVKPILDSCVPIHHLRVIDCL